MAPDSLARRSRNDLERTFGARFGELAFTLAEAKWSEPISSAYGLHLVYIEARERGDIPPIESVSERLRLQIEQRRRDANLDALLSDLRARYEVVRPNLIHTNRLIERTQEPG